MTTVVKITGPVIAWMIWMKASASHFAFSAWSGATSPKSDAERDRDQHPEPELRDESAARTIVRGRGGGRRHAQSPSPAFP